MKTNTKRLQAAIHAVITGALTLRSASRHYSIPCSTLRDNVKAQRDGTQKERGRPPCLTVRDERLIADAILEFADRGFPLQRCDMADMVQMYVARLPLSRRSRLPFKDNRPGRDYLQAFLKRHPDIRLRRRAALEYRRKVSMSPRNLAMHYARLAQTYKKFNIMSAAQIFNIDESGVSSRTGGRGKGMAAMRAKGRSNAVDLEFASNAEHLTIMPVVSGDGERWGPVVIMPGVQQKYRIKADNKKEFLLDYLPKNTFIVHRTPASMTKEFFIQWVQHFIEETEVHRKKHKYLVLTMDGFGAHLSYRALSLLSEHNIIAYALPAHTSHRTQVLDYSVFSPFKEKLRQEWSKRLIGTQAMRINDAFTLCEMVNHAYRKSVTQTNIIDGFHACGLWSLRGGGVDHTVISESDITNRDADESGPEAYTRYQDLVRDFAASRDVLESDGPNLVNGHLNSVSGVMCRRADLLEALRQQEEERERAVQEREQREADRERRREERDEQARLAEERRKVAQQERQIRDAQRAAEAARKAAEKAEKERQKEANKLWDAQLQQRWVHLAASRSERRRKARLRKGGMEVTTEVATE